MVKFCPECGAKFEVTNPKFCPECGFSLSSIVQKPDKTLLENVLNAPKKRSPAADSKDTTKKESFEPQLAKNVYELGTKLEEVVEKIFCADGYVTEKRVRVTGKGNYKNEIDIVARKGPVSLAIECKNHKESVGIKELRDFAKKLDDLGEEWQGVFVAYNDLTEDARNFAESNNIETFGHEDLVERWLAISIGRLNKRGEKISLESSLSINTDFIKATSIDIKNKDKVTVTDARLIFHPYFKIPYIFKAEIKDPNKRIHHLQDKGTVVVDLLDGDVINPLIRNEYEELSRTWKSISSSEKKQENANINKIIREISSSQPAAAFSLTIGQDYEVSKLKEIYTKRGAGRTAKDYIVKKNTHQIQYECEDTNGFPNYESMHFVPTDKHIQLIGGELVYIPKWLIHFSSSGTKFTRELLAHSGTVLEDTIQYCPLHFKLGALSVRKKTTAVCEVCGKAFCEEHIDQCPICKRWICKDHSVICSSCRQHFCKDDAIQLPGDSLSFVCKNCVRECPICKKIVGKVNLHTCEKCGITGCPSCVKKTGILKKINLCKKCIEAK